jgi:hypothetical protein
MPEATVPNDASDCSLSYAFDEQAWSRPDDIFFSIPRDDDDLSQGFIDITCGRFVSAINHATGWLRASIGKSAAPLDVIAYQGPNDLRYPILAMAAAKTGQQVRQQ